MDDAIERVIADVRRYSEAGERLAERLLQQSRWNEQDIERLRSGTSLAESCHATDSAQPVSYTHLTLPTILRV